MGDRLEDAKNNYARAAGLSSKFKARARKAYAEYDGQPYGNEKKGYSSVVVRTIAREVLKVVPTIVESFLESDRVVVIEANRDKFKKAFWEHYLNKVVIENMNFVELMERIVRTMLIQPRTWISPTWEVKKRNGKLISTPKIEVLDYEKLRIDPSARTDDDIEFFTYEERVQVSALLAELTYMTGTATNAITEVKKLSERQNMARTIDTIGNSGDGKVKIVRYIGYMDDTDDQTNSVSREIAWIENTDILLYDRAVRTPNDRLPIYGISFMAGRHTTIGEGLAEVMSASQKIITTLKRGMIDNIDDATNGRIFYDSGMSPDTLAALASGSKYIPFDGKDSIIQGKFTAIPQTVFQMYASEKSETTELSGSRENGFSVEKRMMSEDGEQMTQSQAMTTMQIRKVGEALKLAMLDVVGLASANLTNEEKIDLVHNDELMTVFEDTETVRMNKQAGTAMSRMQTANQINMLLQQSASNKEVVSKEQRTSIIADLFSTLGKYEIAEGIAQHIGEEQEPEGPSMEAIQAQLEMENIRAKTESENAKALYTKTKAANDTRRTEVEIRAQEAATYKRRAEQGALETETAIKTAQHIQDSNGLAREGGTEAPITK